MRKLLIVTTALAAIAGSPAFAEDACLQTVPADITATLGAPVAWLGAGNTIHAPPDLAIMGLPVAYVLVVRAGGSDDGAVTEMDYRLKGAKRPFGERYSIDVRKAFDKNFSADCATGNSSCSVNMSGASSGQLTDVELSEGELSMPKGAHGDGLPLVKADLDLDNADPVFLDCVYKPAK